MELAGSEPPNLINFAGMANYNDYEQQKKLKLAN